jgi:hypothetical protein
MAVKSGVTGRAGDGTSNTDHGPLSARPKRAGAIAGLVGAVLLVVTLVLLSSLPAADAPGRTILTQLHGRYGVTVVAGYTGILTSMLLIPFTASLKTLAPEPHGDAQWRWTITLLSAAAAASLFLAGSALLAAAAVLAGQTTDASAVSALFAGAKTCLTFALTPCGVLILVNARTVSSSTTPVRWLIRLDLEIGILALVSSGATFIHSGWFGAGQPVVAVVGLIVALWVGAMALVMLEGEEAVMSG